MSIKAERYWRGFAVLAACVYLLSIFAPWYARSYVNKSPLRALAVTFTGAHGIWMTDLGITALVLCYLILVFALLGPRRSALSLARQRRALASALALLTVFSFISSFWRVTGWNPSAWFIQNPASTIPTTWRNVFSRVIGYGAWTALGSSLALLLAVAVLDEGGLRRLFDRLPGWLRLDRLWGPEKAPRKLASPAERRRRGRTAIVIAALIVYLISLLMSWWVVSPPPFVFGLGGIGQLSALAALAAIATTWVARAERAQRTENLRNALVASLAVLTVVNVFVIWREVDEIENVLGPTHSRPDWGVLAGLIAVTLLLVATFVLSPSRRASDRSLGRTGPKRLDTGRSRERP